ncbi:DEAD/DEAH box helicase [Aquibacillus halophilus]|uniref:DEAD/DEAH box helicase n=1 Tax=Aquibacillus halophilus TaxID=930132 RepID=A0A6A8D7S5_9BACI|nr:DEAD/DEAH box helicase [Aquibacillus halophilus]MRH41805.1 DEAD/DEAH box helicase [Aquibacillus halophilus]
MINSLKPFLKNAWESSGYENLTPIQQKTAPLITEGKDVIAESPTGSGKTLAYILPILQEIDLDQKHVQVIILASSHELVMQINQELQRWTTGSGITSTTLIGGANIKRQLEKLKKKPHIVLGTPGRIQEILKLKKLKVHQVKTLVLDEGDQLIVPEHLSIIQEVIKGTPKERQLLLFSATLPPTVEQLAKTFMNSPEVIRVTNKELDIPSVNHIYFVCEERDKIETLRKVVQVNQAKALVFFRDIGTLTVMAEKLEYKGISVGVIHGDSKKQAREQAIKEFRSGQSELLLATDVAARGLDIQDLTHVIHMDIPNKDTQYIHRSGRTGRLGSTSGTVISIVTKAEESILQKISRKLDIPMEKKVLYKGQIVDSKKDY